MIIRVRESKHASYTPRQTFGATRIREGPRPLPEAGAEEGLPRRPRGRSPTEDRPSRLQERSVRRGSRTTTTRLYAPPKAAGGRRDFMFTNFNKPGNDAPETRRRRKVKPHGIGASTFRNPRCRGGTRRIAFSPRSEKGGNATGRGFIDRAIDDTRVSARLFLRGRKNGRRDRRVVRHDVPSTSLRNCSPQCAVTCAPFLLAILGTTNYSGK